MPNLRDKLKKVRADKIPQGWYNRDEMAEREGYSVEGCYKSIIVPALKAGLLERRHFCVPWGDAIRRKPYYRYVKK